MNEFFRVWNESRCCCKDKVLMRAIAFSTRNSRVDALIDKNADNTKRKSAVCAL